MKTEPYPPITSAGFEKMCKEWMDVILSEESGTWIWPPLNAPYRRIQQFQKDINLQKKLIGSAHTEHEFIYLDLEQRDEISKEALYGMIKDAILMQCTDQKEDLSLLHIIDQITANKQLSLFVTGVDQMIRTGKWGVLDELTFIAHRNWKTHILLFLETDITHPHFFPHFSKRTTLSQNIYVTPLYNPADTDSFITYMCFNWGVVLNAKQEKWIKQNYGGCFILVKDAIRNIRKNNSLKPGELDQLPSMLFRGQAIVDDLLPDQRKVLEQITKGIVVETKLHHSKRLLIQLGFLREAKDKLVITVPYLQQFLINPTVSKPEDVSLIFTPIEAKTYAYLQAQVGKIVSREKLAELMWEHDWENMYSDWAIDQMIHRVRQKIKQVQVPYEIKTKKGIGFILVSQ